MTVNNAKGKKITLTDNTQSYSKTLDLLYDNNFVEDEFSINEISEITADNYSVGQIQYSDNNEKFVTENIVSDSTFEKN